MRQTTRGPQSTHTYHGSRAGRHPPSSLHEEENRRLQHELNHALRREQSYYDKALKDAHGTISALEGQLQLASPYRGTSGLAGRGKYHRASQDRKLFAQLNMSSSTCTQLTNCHYSPFAPGRCMDFV